MTEEDKKWEEYLIPGTDGVLKNKFGIRDNEELKIKESEVVFKKLVELYEEPINGNFDKKHLCDIHKYLFEEIYPFAGQYRTVFMGKGNLYVTSVKNIDIELEIVIKEMNEELATCHYFEDYARFLANTYSALIKVHPFREGNGRTVREFLRELVETRIPNYKLDWSQVDSNNMLEGIRMAFFTKTLLEMEFQKALVEDKDRIKGR